MGLYSHSKISTFEQCPLKFKFSYIDNIKTEIEETIEAFLGSRVHEALEKLYTDLKYNKLLSEEELIEFYNKKWNENYNDAIIIVKEEYTQENYKSMGEKFLRDYYKRYRPFNQSRTIALETQNTVALDSRHHIHIRIDRLSIAEDGVYEIHDYKTSNTLPTQEDLDKDRQLAVYAYGIKKMYPDAKKIKLIWHYLAFDKEMCSERTEEDLEKLRKEVIKSIEKIESCTEFLPKESSLCGWCEFQNICPNFKHLYELEHKSEEEYKNDDGVNLVNEYVKAEKEEKEASEKKEKLKKAIIEFAKKNNFSAVYGSDVKVLVKNYPSIRFPQKNDPKRTELIKIIKEIGLFEELATIDTYELAKMINNKEIHEELLKLIEKFITKEDNYRLYLSKK